MAILICSGISLGGASLDAIPRDRSTEVLRPARLAAYPPGEFAGQENFMTAGEIRALAATAGFGPGSRVLDICCGAGGAARLLAREAGCELTGVDRDRGAIRLARSFAQAANLDGRARFLVAAAPKLPFAGPFDGVLLLETILAFPNKAPLLAEIARLLRPGGRYAGTIEEGQPLSAVERASLPGGETVHLLPEGEFRVMVAVAGFSVVWLEDHTAAHAELARRLTASFTADRPALAAGLGETSAHDLLIAQARWVDWLGSGRVRKLAFILEREG